VAVRIRMKQMGRAHRHYYRIVAIDKRQPRDGKVIEELGSYDPHLANKDERVTLVPSRIKYWLSVGAKPSDNCQIFINKYMKKFEDLETQAAADTAKKTEEATSVETAPTA
jgi:small subunit ribosomal protein S16